MPDSCEGRVHLANSNEEQMFGFGRMETLRLFVFTISKFEGMLTPARRYVRVVKETDLKSVGLRPRRQKQKAELKTTPQLQVPYHSPPSHALSPRRDQLQSHTHFPTMIKLFNKTLRRFCSNLRWPLRRRSSSKIVIKRFGKSHSAPSRDAKRECGANGFALVHPNSQLGSPESQKPVRIATFNAALFSMAPALPKAEKGATFDDENGGTVITRRPSDVKLRAKSANDRPKSILKQSPLHPNSMNSPDSVSNQEKFAKSKLRVSINLPDNEISLLRSRQSSFSEYEKEGSSNVVSKGKVPMKASASLSGYTSNRSSRTVLEVLRELDADILALQDVKAEEENGMKPLSDLASLLGMNYVFAESWAPEYGNAILSKWPIKHWKVQKIFDDTDFRNVLKATIEVPQAGEVNFYCTHLDHLDENWRMKQMNAIIQCNDEPHILAGGLNSLDETDYSQERWTDIAKYYEEMGKPTPKSDLMRYLKSKQYTDAKEFSGECESVVMIAKGQSVQGTCKYGTRVDYILSSSNSPFKFVPGSYLVLSSKGTSDHHIVKVDVVKSNSDPEENVKKQRKRGQKVLRITQSNQSKGIWSMKSEQKD
ncbi:uncharacterized protein LOC114720728 [Neltuma alba]|uniref:uncharacterized protein LOC114720728 n=1 Tax=Neltuma alba TaxID=207710 RepID=UPI0010A59527|nr:uncharacterized protein LOC114720728 [Prosopis alba]